MSARATAAFLQKLLNQPPPRGRYRELWAGKAEKPRKGELSQAAVARVITEHLTSKGRTVPDHRAFRSLVSRALTGVYLSKETLSLFIDAFAMTEDDAQKLWMLFAGAKLAATSDWTIDLRSNQPNSSRAFQKAVESVDTLIRARFPEKKKGDTKALAELIVAHLAHNEHFAPRRLS